MLRFLIKILIITTVILTIFWVLIAQPSCKKSKIQEFADPSQLKKHTRHISENLSPRSSYNLENLDKTAQYIKNNFYKKNAIVTEQSYSEAKTTFKNISCLFKKKANSSSSERIVIGAHYDAYSIYPGADDNASGAAGLIELANKIDHNYKKIKHTEIELVAYSTEEPPHFGSSNMGSYHHAKKLHNKKISVKAVIILEMIGYFSEEKKSQSYPLNFLRLIYPNKGNFIAVIGKMWDIKQRYLIKKVKNSMKGNQNLPVYSISAPPSLPGIDFSNHRNYWIFNYPTIMISDTAFYRNKNYHTKNDTWDTLNYKKMAHVIDSVFNTILLLNK